MFDNRCSFNNEIIGRAVHRQRDRFIEGLRSREDEILRLAASSCGQPSACFFSSRALGDYYARGSYNALFFVELASGSKCVVRIPLRPALAYCPRLKLQCEIATMKHLSESTSIPVPKILAYSVESGDDPLSTFLVLEYIDGKVLSPAAFGRLTPDAKNVFYGSLADVYVQLRRQEFPSIGRLKLGAEGIGAKTASVDMNMMLLEGIDPVSIQDFFYGESGILQSANQYTRMLQVIGYNAFVHSRNAIGAEVALEGVYNQQFFSKHVESWLDPELDSGPFVLSHGDLHVSNLMLDDDSRIIGVLDWEWSRVVPLQFLTPPTWISGNDTVQLAHPNSWYLFRKRDLAEFLKMVKAREEERYQNTTLYDEWSRRTGNAEPLVANALDSWTNVDWFAIRFHGEGKSQSEDTLSAFEKEDPLHGLLAELKACEVRKYEQELEKLELSEESEAALHKDANCHGLVKVTSCMLPRHELTPSVACVILFTIAACVILFTVAACAVLFTAVAVSIASISLWSRWFPGLNPSL